MSKYDAIFDTDEEDDKPLITDFYVKTKRRPQGSPTVKTLFEPSSSNYSSNCAEEDDEIAIISSSPIRPHHFESPERSRKGEAGAFESTADDSIQIISENILEHSPGKVDKLKKLVTVFEDSDDDDDSKPLYMRLGKVADRVYESPSQKGSNGRELIQSDDDVSPDDAIDKLDHSTPGKSKKKASSKRSNAAKRKAAPKSLNPVVSDLIVDEDPFILSPAQKKAKNKAKKKTPLKADKVDKGDVRRRKQQEAEEAKKLIEFNKQQNLKNSLVNCRAVIDSDVIDSFGATKEELHRKFSEYEIFYDLVDSPAIENSVVWTRKTKSLSGEVTLKEEDQVLVILEFEDFVRLVHGYKERTEVNLFEFAKNTSLGSGNKSITIIVHGLSKYFKSRANKANLEFTAAINGNVAKSRRKSLGLPTIERVDIDEALIDLELRARNARVVFTETTDDLVTTLATMTKAVAEAPAKRKRNEQAGFEWFVQGDSVASVEPKTPADGQKLWIRQLQQFPKVSLEIAESIAAVYPSLRQLMAKFEETDHAENLLQDVIIGNSMRRLGAEMSRKLHLFFCAADGGLYLSN